MGSTFWFTLPCQPAQSMVSASEPDSSQLEGISLLVVEDNPNLRELVTEQTTRWGMVVTAAEDGAKGFQLAHERAQAGHPFAMIYTDFNMPEMNGREMVAALRHLTDYEKTPVLLVSATDTLPDHIEHDTHTFLAEKPALAVNYLPLLLKAFSNGHIGIIGEHVVEEHRVPAALYPLHVLVVDDNRVNCMVVCNMLSKFGCRSQAAEDGRQAVDEMVHASQAYDLIFMDCEMPVMDGWEATKTIRQWERDHDSSPCKIIGLTGHGETVFLQKCLQVGMDDVCVKPIKLEQLGMLLRTYGGA